MKPGVFDHIGLEAKWNDIWLTKKVNTSDIAHAAKPFYNLMMFPYPSAEGLHVGNMYAFTGSDIYGRFKRMQGYDVFEPIGLDGFGIHSENYALKIGKHPMDHATITQTHFYNQLKNIGAMFDWDRTLETYDPLYYRWTQWLFVQMFKHGLAYRDRANVNWCPSDKTVLADEQVIDGKCERCGNIVEKRALEQWFFRITDYAGKLLSNLRTLDWSDKVKVAQTNWIGKKEGINISYHVVDEQGKSVGEVTCFTTRPDTNFGATFVVIAPEHPFVSRVKEVIKMDQAASITRYVEATKAYSEVDRIAQGRKKTGVFTHLYCINELNNARMPLYISDFVLMNFGTGAVVGVPGHDERDYAFAIQFDIPILKVVDFNNELHAVINKQYVKTGFEEKVRETHIYFEIRDQDFALVANEDEADLLVQIIKDYIKDNHGFAQIDGKYKGLITQQGVVPTSEATPFLHNNGVDLKTIWFTNKDGYVFCFTKDGIMVNSGFLDGLDSQSAIGKMMDYLEKKGWGKRVTTYHLRDWLISRQRYWGPPIPMIYCKKCAVANKGERADMPGWYTVGADDLPVLLPRIEDYKPGDDGIAPLAKHKEFYETSCPGCGGKAVRETDVSDTFLDSSWYFLRYPSIGKATVANENASDAVHGSRFDSHPQSPTDSSPSRKGAKAVRMRQNTRPAASTQLPWDPAITKKWLPVHMYTGGAEHSVLHLLYSRFVTMALKDWGYLNFEEPFTKFYAHGLVIKDGAKMSKSKGNVVNPDEYIRLYGSDALRMYLMFMGPFDQGGDFRDSSMEGMSRWMGRVWRMAQLSLDKRLKSSSATISSALQEAIKRVGDDLEKRRYNTAIAGMMELTNLVGDEGGAVGIEDLKKFILILAPFAPHITEELWFRCTHPTSTISSYKDFKVDQSVHVQPWPNFDESKILRQDVQIAVQVNGKLRDTFPVKEEYASIQKVIETEAKNRENVRKYLAGKAIKKIIFVPGKLINFVI